MSLPILNVRSTPTASDLLRLFAKSEMHFCQQISDSVQLDVGTALASPQYRSLADANQVMDALLPDGMSPGDCFELVEDHFAHAGTQCRGWQLNGSMPADRRTALRSYLLANGFSEACFNVFLLQKSRLGRIGSPADLKIIPARASYKHMRLLCGEMESAGQLEQFVEAELQRLDDPHWDMLLAIRDSRPVACAGVLAVGELGRIDRIFVSPSARRMGLGKLMLSRVLEICGRALFKHVVLKISPNNPAGESLAKMFGFQNIGQCETLVRM